MKHRASTPRTQEPICTADTSLACICAVLAGQARQVDWAALTAADWRHLVRQAHLHGVAPLLAHHLEQAGWPEPLPDAVRHALRHALYQTTASNTLLYRELGRIVDCLHQQNIPVVVLKGAALAQTHYAHIGLRPMLDLDLLLPRSHLAQAIQALWALDYVQIPEPGMGFYQISKHHMLRNNHAPHLLVELHGRLVASDADRRAPPMDWFWEQTETWPTPAAWPVPASAGQMLQLTPTANLLYLTAHMMLQHAQAEIRLGWLYDLHLLVTRDASRIDWNEGVRQAAAFHWGGILQQTLQQAQACFGTSSPPGLLDRLAALHAADTQPVATRPAHPLQTRPAAFWHSFVHRSWAGRLQSLWNALFPSHAYLSWRYQLAWPRWLWPLAYPYRWADLVWDMLQTLARHVGARGVPKRK